MRQITSNFRAFASFCWQERLCNRRRICLGCDKKARCGIACRAHALQGARTGTFLESHYQAQEDQKCAEEDASRDQHLRLDPRGFGNSCESVEHGKLPRMLEFEIDELEQHERVQRNERQGRERERYEERIVHHAPIIFRCDDRIQAHHDEGDTRQDYRRYTPLG